MSRVRAAELMNRRTPAAFQNIRRFKRKLKSRKFENKIWKVYNASYFDIPKNPWKVHKNTIQNYPWYSHPDYENKPSILKEMLIGDKRANQEQSSWNRQNSIRHTTSYNNTVPKNIDNKDMVQWVGKVDIHTTTQERRCSSAIPTARCCGRTFNLTIIERILTIK